MATRNSFSTSRTNELKSMNFEAPILQGKDVKVMVMPGQTLRVPGG
jgi:hypothetical protein